jgi:hypothetical protein
LSTYLQRFCGKCQQAAHKMCGDDFDELSGAAVPSSKYVDYWLCAPCTNQERCLVAESSQDGNSQDGISQEDISQVEIV